MDNLKKFVKSSSVIVETLFDKQGGTLAPMYHVVAPAGEGVMPAPGAHLGKDASLNLMRELLKQLQATRVLYVDEAWVLVAGPDYEHDGGTSLEHHPDRVEEVIFLAEDIEEGSMMASRRIVRDGDGKATLDPLVFKDMGTFSGRMAGLLPTKGRGH